jgi:hypothetical protein
MKLEGSFALKTKKKRSKFTRKTNPKISMFDLCNHVGLRMTIPLEQIVAPLQNTDEMDGEIITLA